MKITSAPETADRAMQPQTKPPSPRRSKKKDPESRLFTSIILSVCGTPWGRTSAQLPGGPRVWRPEKVEKNIKGYHIFALGAQNPDKPPACRPIAPHPCPSPPPQRPLDVDDVSMGRADPGSSIAPTGLWCPDGSHPTARAPPPPRPSRSHHSSSPEPAPRGERLRSEGTDNALRRTGRALRSLLGVVCIVMNVFETLKHPHHPVPRRGALQPRQASTASSRKSSEVLFLVVEARQSEARRARLRAKAVERMSTGTIDYM